MTSFVHLHVHTEYSLLDGAVRIRDLVQKTKKCGMKAVAMTDHGVMYATVPFYKACREQGIKPIIGCEVYTAAESRFDKEKRGDAEYGHLVLLAKNQIGYQNLMKLVTRSWTEGLYYKPRVDIELLKTYSEGLIALSACLAGDVPRLLLADRYEEAKKKALSFRDIFGDDHFYLELQYNAMEEQNRANEALIRLSDETGLPLVATNDVHYLNREDSKMHDVLLCVQTQCTVNDPNRMSFETDEFFLKTPDEMRTHFAHRKNALENTVKIAEMCDVSLDFETMHLPAYIPNKDEPDESHEEKLKRLAEEGMHQKYGDKATTDPSIQKRLDYELSVIKQMGYIDYFLIVWDYIRYARQNKITVGPGRGSAAGCLVSYCLDIITVDPFRYDLIFERFLNPERISMPDIDSDFSSFGRQKVIEYVINKYGSEHVAQIITFGTLGARAAVRDVGRALDIPYSRVDQVAKMLPSMGKVSIKDSINDHPTLKKMVEEDPQIKELFDLSMKVEGMPRHCSVHASGLVVTEHEVDRCVPLQIMEGNMVTMCTMNDIEELGLLKMDFLGLKNLDVIDQSIRMIEQNHKITIDIETIDLEDEDVFEMIGQGHTSGLFQLESTGMTAFMKNLKPQNLEEIIAGISLYRPGPMDSIPTYIENRKNPEKIEYLHPMLKDILDVTYGCMVYQEQVMSICRHLAGYSAGRADTVRKIMSKKKHEDMEKEREVFVYGLKDSSNQTIVSGCVKNGIDEKTAHTLYDKMTSFGSYAFNKSHAAAYAYICYREAWLKCHYPIEFHAALLNSHLDRTDKIAQYVYECNKLDIRVLPPDINRSNASFTVYESEILFGLNAVKSTGEKAVQAIIEERNENGAFADFPSFCKRMGKREVNKRCIENLIRCGAFDSMGIYRSRLLSVFEKIIDGYTRINRQNVSGQMTLFLEDTPEFKQNQTVQYPNIDEFEPSVLLAIEKEILGFYISGHPMNEHMEILSKIVTFSSKDMPSEDEPEIEKESMTSASVTDRQEVVTAGSVVNVTQKTTKNNKMMAFVEIEDLYGSMEIVVFPNVYQSYGELLTNDRVIVVKGTLDIKDETEIKILCQKIFDVKNIPSSLPNSGRHQRKSRNKKDKSSSQEAELYIRLQSKTQLDTLRHTIEYFRGSTPVVAFFEDTGTYEPVKTSYGIDLSYDRIFDMMKRRYGKRNVVLKNRT